MPPSGHSDLLNRHNFNRKDARLSVVLLHSHSGLPVDHPHLRIRLRKGQKLLKGKILQTHPGDLAAVGEARLLQMLRVEMQQGLLGQLLLHLLLAGRADRLAEIRHAEGTLQPESLGLVVVLRGGLGEGGRQHLQLVEVLVGRLEDELPEGHLLLLVEDAEGRRATAEEGGDGFGQAGLGQLRLLLELHPIEDHMVGWEFLPGRVGPQVGVDGLGGGGDVGQSSDFRQQMSSLQQLAELRVNGLELRLDDPHHFLLQFGLLLLQLPLPLRQPHPLQHHQRSQRLSLQVDEDRPHFPGREGQRRCLEQVEGKHPLLAVLLEEVRVAGRKQAVEGQWAVRTEADVGDAFFLLRLLAWPGLLQFQHNYQLSEKCQVRSSPNIAGCTQNRLRQKQRASLFVRVGRGVAGRGIFQFLGGVRMRRVAE